MMLSRVGGAHPIRRAAILAPSARDADDHSHDWHNYDAAGSSQKEAFGVMGTTINGINNAGMIGSSSSRLGVSSVAMMATPVWLPPGRARLSTRPVATGSFPVKKMIGIVEVAFFAASRR
jgi:hypothetical protein